MDYADDLFKNKIMFFGFMKEKYPFFYKSNIFFRDIQYSVMRYFEKKNIKIKYALAEKITTNLLEKLVKDESLIKIDNKSFKVNFLVENEVS
ncbi:MAG: hypothetical protein V1773_06290 [bacterium]